MLDVALSCLLGMVASMKVVRVRRCSLSLRRSEPPPPFLTPRRIGWYSPSATETSSTLRISKRGRQQRRASARARVVHRVIVGRCFAVCHGGATNAREVVTRSATSRPREVGDWLACSSQAIGTVGPPEPGPGLRATTAVARRRLSRPRNDGRMGFVLFCALGDVGGTPARLAQQRPRLRAQMQGLPLVERLVVEGGAVEQRLHVAGQAIAAGRPS